MKRISSYFIIGIISAVTAIAISHFLYKKNATIISEEKSGPFKFASYNSALPADAFVEAAKTSTPTVVHINTIIKTKKSDRNSKYVNPFYQFFGDPFGNSPYDMPPQQDQEASGSGVIISNDGYIVTNNHVVENADEIKVSLYDNREFSAKVIGTDPNTDLAVIKIDGKDLQFLTFANSDNVQVGQWVLAVGNPFNLSSTVTAGIVSAKTRNINILREKAGNLAIESFIQTDAAVNPGNSGGALVDLSGNLIGINSAIATPTGSYAGYSFAIPANLVNKVVKDMIDFGVVQRGFLGVSIREIDDELAKDLKLNKIQGAYIAEVNKGSAAEDGGVKRGDVIMKVGDAEIKNSADLQEHVARYRPGDKVKLSIFRDGNMIAKDVVLKSKDNKTALLSKEDAPKTGNVLDNLGIAVDELSSLEAKKLGVSGGLKVTKINDGIIKQNTSMQEGFIIIGINNRSVTKKSDLIDLINESKGNGILLQGKYPDQNGLKYYAFGY
ncbi:MAG TPA: Do family serine endopeptidase [Chitinophagales bacterium]|nr:Do family serine endopeptidase [Chitinophagales bacterium]HNC71574.1 Do family serine endopeptidase [Chitinophagales bacterium]HND82606.1 Do family serine endopeptidase [Chitinophagales bacterium]HNF50495.1 Do family serine endopeptidase [Chitinophagales bacterium]HNG70458.1 Do family serine endopeptidase [Chitinophagales bacterium]